MQVQARENLPAARKCLTSGVIYRAIVTRNDNDKQEMYIFLTNNRFKPRYAARISSFKSNNRKNAKTLNQYSWTLKNKGITYNMYWKSVAKGKYYWPKQADAFMFEREIHHDSPAPLGEFEQ